MYEDSQHGKTIDLSGPDGNAFFLLGIARKWGKQLDLDVPTIMSDMQAGDYAHLLTVFREHFGHVVTLLNDTIEESKGDEEDDDELSETDREWEKHFDDIDRLT